MEESFGARRARIKPLWIGYGVLAVLLVVMFWAFAKASGAGNRAEPDKTKYQGVFLTNNQSYFGKLTFEPGFYVLRDVHYLQQTKVDTKEKKGTEIKLIKLGDEVHGPTDAMYIEPYSVLFWENLKDDSKVSKAIKQSVFMENNKKPTDAAPEQVP